MWVDRSQVQFSAAISKDLLARGTHLCVCVCSVSEEPFGREGEQRNRDSMMPSLRGQVKDGLEIKITDLVVQSIVKMTRISKIIMEMYPAPQPNSNVRPPARNSLRRSGS